MSLEPSDLLDFSIDLVTSWVPSADLDPDSGVVPFSALWVGDVSSSPSVELSLRGLVKINTLGEEVDRANETAD